MLDIVPGDTLCSDNQEYPIRSASAWQMRHGEGRAFRRMANHPATTRRNPAVVNSQRGVPVDYLNVQHTPLDPVSPELKQRMALNTPHTLLQTFVADGDGFIHLVIEDLKR